MRESIKESIDELKSEITCLPADEEEAKSKLSELVKELEIELENRDDDSFDDFIEPLRDSISSFETSHPKMTQLINNVMNALSGIGI